MAIVRYLGWTDRSPSRENHVTGGGSLKKSIRTPDGERYVFRGRAGRKSRRRKVDSQEAIEFFADHEDFEVES
ncbi:hypothetical protein BRC97_09910 [Halobacteriales archaeon QS_6_71_20]|nr:MAG: hypothetical protein BRC97_09910 [Halobacteriales archaeon QS_6_71_20]